MLIKWCLGLIIYKCICRYFFGITLCDQLWLYRQIRGKETSANFEKITWYYMPEWSSLYSAREKKYWLFFIRVGHYNP